MCRFVYMLPYLKHVILFLLFPLVVFGQGKSFTKIYSPKEYDAHAQNWCVIQDNDGLIYIGNTTGLLIFDGKKWEPVKLNNSIVRSLDKDKNDKIFYGAQGEFGYLYADNAGKVKNKSLVYLLPDSLRLFGDVWKTYCFQNKVIFQTFDYIFIYENEKIAVIEAENYYHFGYQRGEDFYIIDREIGLKKLVNNKVEPVGGGDFFAKYRIYGWINYKDYSLVVTREKGVFKVGFNTDGSITIAPFITEIDTDLVSGEVYCSLLLSNGNLGFGTLYQGFYITDAHGKLLQVINKTTGLKCEIIKGCYEDKQKGLWLALDVGISRIEINNGFQSIAENEGIEGIVNTTIAFNNSIFCGTTKGFFEVNKAGVHRMQDFNNDVRYLLKVGEGASESIILLTEIGTYRLNKAGNLLKLNDEDGLFMVKRNGSISEYFIGTQTGLCLFDNQNNSTTSILKTIPEIRRIAEDSNGSLWLGTSHSGVYRIEEIDHQEPKQIYYDTLKGLPDNSYNLPFIVQNTLYFATFKGIYSYNPAKDIFEKNTAFAAGSYGKTDQIYQIIEGFNKQVWLFKTNAARHEFILYNTASKQATFPLKRMGEFDAYQSIYPENDSITWFGGPDGLFRYNAAKKSFDTLHFKTKVRGVYCNNDTLFGGFYGFDQSLKRIQEQPTEFIPELIYRNNNINFEFAALSFDNEKENVFSFYLEGFDNSWSDWTPESKKSYTNLNEGTYTFHVKSKNVYGKAGEEDTYTFTILPPWYRTGWAYAFYAVGTIVIIYLITQLSVRRLKRAKVRLEAIVINRTAEVVAEKEEVEKQKKIVEVKNKDITDSINYAQRIQQAILPLPEDFTKVFPESFIYFQPRDIVSGDFYWFYQPKKTDRNWVYIAAADCTGHGVPGAFMSMIGNTLLNEILNEKQIYDTDQILNHLHIEVRAALKQDTSQNTTNDGMDIALCRIDLDTLELQYAGANRALYVFKHNENGTEFIDIKPNKFPIGGYQAETTRSFTPHTIQLAKHDTFYIFSDGYADQFGGVSNKKFMVKRLQNELMSMQKEAMLTQKELVKKLVMDWKGDAEQVDDILLIGVRI